MENRITQLFETKKENILSIYFTAGYPNLKDTIKIIKNLSQSGVDLIEIGFPFSDPLADGPVIQQSSNDAIENGMTLEFLFNELQDIRKITDVPLVMMGYLNVILQYGESEFIAKCAEIGIDGLIIPDLPLNYYESNFKSACEANNISNILLITPETAVERIHKIDSLSTGFNYLVSSNSITGATNVASFQENYFERIKQMNLKNPSLIGFGVHDKKTYDTVCQYAAGAIIGSAFIKHLSEFGAEFAAVEKFVSGIRAV
jgi:tryptophan synthase alpha chain